ncbi:MAG: hypothetical protein C0481_02815 [Phenylobacterium sp.]|uniref:hypothetical protein n=1 Tax=Phenylobacterium sp. TaxID=1871053 RepID=UPI0025D287E2|nr:hypothetical protein [Phenylobacterium sp.]MBA4010776.1 hypothetical protein [Phenylobacterium sp.]
MLDTMGDKLVAGGIAMLSALLSAGSAVWIAERKNRTEFVVAAAKAAEGMVDAQARMIAGLERRVDELAKRDRESWARDAACQARVADLRDQVAGLVAQLVAAGLPPYPRDPAGEAGERREVE